MGKAYSALLRPLKNYNVKERAHKILDAEKPKAAPRYPSYRQWNETPKNGLDEFQKRDDKLAKHLKSVYVVSQESMSIAKASLEQEASHNRRLPSQRRSVEHPALGYVEPERVTEGHVSLMQAINFIMEHQNDPEKVTAKVIADNHKLDEEVVVQVLKHFSAFELHVPQQEKDVTLVQRIAQLPKMLTPKSDKNKSQQ